MSIEKPEKAEPKGLRKAFFEVGAKAGLKKEILDYFSHLLDNPSDFEGYKKTLIFKGDYVRTFLFTITFAYSNGRLRNAYDGQLGLVNSVYAASQYLPIYGVTKEVVDELRNTRQDMQFITEWLSKWLSETIVGSGYEIRVYQQWARRRGYDSALLPDVLFFELENLFRQRMDDIMVEVDKAIYPLASSHRQPQPSGGEDWTTGGAGSGADPADLAKIAMTAVTGVQAPKD